MQTALRDVFWAISYMSDQGNEFVATLVESGIIVPLVESLRTPRPGLLGPALRALGNFVAGNDLQCQVHLCSSPLGFFYEVSCRPLLMRAY